MGEGQRNREGREGGWERVDREWEREGGMDRGGREEGIEERWEIEGELWTEGGRNGE